LSCGCCDPARTFRCSARWWTGYLLQWRAQTTSHSPSSAHLLFVRVVPDLDVQVSRQYMVSIGNPVVISGSNSFPVS
jgi:hypothetical protein